MHALNNAETDVIRLAIAIGGSAQDTKDAIDEIADAALRDADIMTPDEFNAWWAACACAADLEPERVVIFANDIVRGEYAPPESTRSRLAR